MKDFFDNSDAFVQTTVNFDSSFTYASHKRSKIVRVVTSDEVMILDDQTFIPSLFVGNAEFTQFLLTKPDKTLILSSITMKPLYI